MSGSQTSKDPCFFENTNTNMHHMRVYLQDSTGKCKQSCICEDYDYAADGYTICAKPPI